MAAKSQVAATLIDLIAIPSVNPAFLPAGDSRSGEDRMAVHLAEAARRHHLECEFQSVAPGRRNVMVRLSPSRPATQRILLAPHLDTVGEPELDSLLEPRFADGRITGRGACDTKGCVAAMFTAVLNLARSGRRPEQTEIIFAGLVDEENGQCGSRHYARHGPKADLAMVGEPTRLEVVTAHKGDVWLQLITQGRSAHGSTPHLGKNAVREAARIVELLEGEYAEELRRQTHPLLGHPTINVGAIRGGTQPNIVPAECRVDIDRRTLPGETETQVRKEISALLRKRRLKAAFNPLRTAPCDPLETDPELPLVRQLCRAARKTRTVGVNFFCDAAPLAEGGIPSLVFGPGDIAQAHTADEWIAVHSLERGLAILERFLRDLP